MNPESSAKRPPSVTFETKCWQADWRRLLAPGVLEARLEWLDRAFDERVLLVNNVDNEREVRLAADCLVSRGMLSSYVVVEEQIEEALAHFGLTRESLGDGYWYSTAELVGALRCRTDYLVHFAGDVSMGHVCDWVTPGIHELSESNVVAVTPVWNGKLEEVSQDAKLKSSRYWLDQGFSDQCYLVEPRTIRNANLTLDHPMSARYPRYGGMLFERRVDAWMRHNSLLRAVDTRATYVHPA